MRPTKGRFFVFARAQSYPRLVLVKFYGFNSASLPEHLG